MAKRHRDAIGIQQGACNPSGILHSMLEACQEIRAEGGHTQTICEDVALRLMAHQLDYLLNTSEVDIGVNYDKFMEECQNKC